MITISTVFGLRCFCDGVSLGKSHMTDGPDTEVLGGWVGRVRLEVDTRVETR